MKTTLLALSLFLVTLSAYSQYDDPIYGDLIPVDSTINYQKIKFHLSNQSRDFFSIGNITGNPNICKKIKINRYNKIFTDEVYKVIGSAIKKNIPPIDSPNFIDIDIRDLRMVRHQLFSDNYLVELSMDFFLRNDTISRKVCSSSQALFLISTPKFERILAKLIKQNFNYFLENQSSKLDIPYFVNKPEPISPGTFPKGVYTSYDDVRTKKPSISLDGDIVSIEKNGFYRFTLDNQNFNVKGLNNDILGLSDGHDIYLNANRFYPNNYFIKLEKITPNLYYSFDGISDLKSQSNAMAAYGGGLLGVLLMEGIGGVESAKKSGISGSRKCHLVIDIHSGSMIALTHSKLKKLLKGQDNELKRFRKIKVLKDNKMMKSYIEMLIKKELIKPKF